MVVTVTGFVIVVLVRRGIARVNMHPLGKGRDAVLVTVVLVRIARNGVSTCNGQEQCSRQSNNRQASILQCPSPDWLSLV